MRRLLLTMMIIFVARSQGTLKPIDALSMHIVLNKKQMTLVTTKEFVFPSAKTLYFVFLHSLNPGSYYYHINSPNDIDVVCKQVSAYKATWFKVTGVDDPNGLLALLEKKGKELLNNN